MLKFIVYLFICSNVYSQEINSKEFNWKGIFIAGDSSIDNFDLARIDLSKILNEYGACKDEECHFSNSSQYVDYNKVLPPARDMVASAFQNLRINPKNDGCFIFMTSHGSQNIGLGLRGKVNGYITPRALSQLVNAYCKSAPTVILVSSCFSGQFITNELKGPNRVILTASRSDRRSFGCSVEDKYTYWDDCLLSEIKRSYSWREVYENTNICVQRKEKVQGLHSQQLSYPQAFFGKNTQRLRVIYK